jgi:YfiH family protein
MPYEADGLVTNEPGLALICFTADCVPVLLCDARNGVIAAVHCGWRSSVGDILNNVLNAMADLGAAPETTAAAIGPAIARCCFEVGGEVVEAVDRYLGGDSAGLYAPAAGEGKYFLDLKAANARRLVQLGVPEEAVAVSDECTFCLPEKYWSHRYTHGKRGNQGAIITL